MKEGKCIDMPHTKGINETFKKFLEGTGEGRTASTTFVLGLLLSKLLKDKNLGERIVPIIPECLVPQYSAQNR